MKLLVANLILGQGKVFFNSSRDGLTVNVCCLFLHFTWAKSNSIYTVDFFIGHLKYNYEICILIENLLSE